METFARRIVECTARPEWTLLAISELASIAIVLLLRSLFPV